MFSLLLCTLNREKELKACLESLLIQEIPDYEVIIVDQSEDDSSKKLVESIGENRIHYYHVDFKGLSLARNYGIRHSIGDYVCLIDDDAIYPKDFLSRIVELSQDKVIISGIIYSIHDRRTPFIDCSKVTNGKVLSVEEILSYCPSAALVIPSSTFRIMGDFDERLGVGNEFASCEETDFLLRAIDGGYRVVHDKSVIVYHPIKPVNSNDLTGIYKHAMGKGALYKIDKVGRKKNRLLLFALRNTVGMFIKEMTSHETKKDIYRTRRKGFINGYRKFEL